MSEKKKRMVLFTSQVTCAMSEQLIGGLEREVGSFGNYGHGEVEGPFRYFRGVGYQGTQMDG